MSPVKQIAIVVVGSIVVVTILFIITRYILNVALEDFRKINAEFQELVRLTNQSTSLKKIVENLKHLRTIRDIRIEYNAHLVKELCELYDPKKVSELALPERVQKLKEDIVRFEKRLEGFAGDWKK